MSNSHPSFALFNRATNADTTFEFTQIIKSFSHWNGTYNISVYTSCRDGGPPDTLKDSLRVTAIADFNLSLTSAVICPGGLVGLNFHWIRRLTQNLAIPEMENATDSGISMIEPIQANTQYTYLVEDLVPGGLKQDIMTLVCASLAPMFVQVHPRL